MATAAVRQPKITSHNLERIEGKSPTVTVGTAVPVLLEGSSIKRYY